MNCRILTYTIPRRLRRKGNIKYRFPPKPSSHTTTGVFLSDTTRFFLSGVWYVYINDQMDKYYTEEVI